MADRVSDAQIAQKMDARADTARAAQRDIVPESRTAHGKLGHTRAAQSLADLRNVYAWREKSSRQMANRSRGRATGR